MQISGTSTAYGGSQAQSVLSMLLQQKAGGNADAGQEMPGVDAASPAAPPSPPPSGASDKFGDQTLASLISAQEGPPSTSDLANSMLQAADTDGDGELSVDEIAKALGTDTTSGTDALTQAVNKLDTDGDGKLSADELSSGLDAMKQAHHGHHGHHAHKASGAADSSSDLAAQVLKAADSDGDGDLSADELTTAVGDDMSADDVKSALGQLDTDGDGKLSQAELASAFEAFRSTSQYGAQQAASEAATEAAQALVTA